MPQKEFINIDGPQVNAINIGFADILKSPKLPRDLRSIQFWSIQVESRASDYRVSFLVAPEFEKGHTGLGFFRRNYYINKIDFRIVDMRNAG